MRGWLTRYNATKVNEAGPGRWKHFTRAHFAPAPAGAAVRGSLALVLGT